MSSNIVNNHSKAANKDFKIHIESPDKSVQIIEDSSSEDEVQIIDENPKHVAFATSTSSMEAKAMKHKRDKIKSTILPANAKPRPPKSILKTSPSSRDPLADDDDIRNVESVMNALKELEVNQFISE